MFAIEAESVHKSYDALPVLRGLNLRVPVGQVYGLLGPNGAGKSTLIHLLLGMLKPDRGSLRLLGSNELEDVRSRVGYIPERLRYHTRYSAREYLRYLGRFNGMSGLYLKSRIEAELEAVGLLGAADRMLNTYSKGMLQRFGIAQALLAEPEVLLIDEPTSGLDPAGQREMLDLLATVRSRGHTIFLTTHFLDEIEHLCDLVGILFDGQLATEVEVDQLRVPGRNALIEVGTMTPELMLNLQRISPAVRCDGREISLRPNTPELQAQVLRLLLDARVPIIALEPHGRPLEELYLRIVRRTPVEVAPPEDVAPPAELQPTPAAPLLPNSMFAPPGHADADPPARRPAADDDPPADRPARTLAPPARSGSGDTLLRQLLSRDDDADGEPPRP